MYNKNEGKLEKDIIKVIRKLYKYYKFDAFPSYRCCKKIFNILGIISLDSIQKYDEYPIYRGHVYTDLHIERSNITVSDHIGYINFVVFYNGNRYVYKVNHRSKYTVEFDSDTAPNSVDRSLQRILSITIIAHLMIYLKVKLPNKYRGVKIYEII